MSVRYSTGIGWDSHRTTDGSMFILGGVRIPSSFSLAGHSDADVLTHAIIDALLGAASLGDIGEHFPDTDVQYENADSLELLRTVKEQILQAGFNIEHVDTTVVAERPKLLPYKQMMVQNIASTLNLDIANINVKATTGEGVGFVGRGEGVAAMATATLSTER